MHLPSALHICILLLLLFALLFVCLTYPTARMRFMLNVFRYPDSCWFTLQKLFLIWFEFVGVSQTQIYLIRVDQNIIIYFHTIETI